MKSKYSGNKKRISYAGSTILVLIVFGILITTVSASTSYQSTLVKGTEEFIITQYDETAWKNTVNTSSTPSEWFDGTANITNSKSKFTIKGWSYTTWQIYDVLTSIIMPEYFDTEEIFMLLGLMTNQGYNETIINANYTLSYNLWYGLRAVWNFTAGNFEEEPSYIDGVFILENPLLFKTMLDDYNNLSAELNGRLMLPPGYSFPILTADEFLWDIALNGLAIAEPQEQYLLDLLNELGCENASSNGNTLIFERYGVTNYTVEIVYGIKGLISIFNVKDDNDAIIFSFHSSDSNWFFYMILIILSASVVGLVIVLIIRQRKLKKNR
ncbi:MAG: hypothetical protein ACFE8V_03635 [Promethearchaeota archaeon]